MSQQEVTTKIAVFFKNQPVQKAWLFGSYARGEQNEDSDIDILVVFDDNVSLMGHVRIMYDLEELLGKKVDLITDGTLLPFAKESADRDKILIYERTAA